MSGKRLLLNGREAAELLGVSLRHFERHVQPQIPCVYSGRLRLYRPRDLERWVDAQATQPKASGDAAGR